MPDTRRDVNGLVQDLVLRHAARWSVAERRCAREVLAVLRRAEAEVLQAVRASAWLRPVPGEPVLLRVAQAPFRARRAAEDAERAVVQAAAQAAKCLERDLPALARDVLVRTPDVIDRLLRRAAEPGPGAVREGAGDPVAEARAAATAARPRVGASFSQVPLAQAAVLVAGPLGGAAYADAFADLSTRTTARLRNVLVGGVRAGRGVPQVARAVQGVLRDQRWQAERIVRSEFVRAGNQAALLTYQANRAVVKSVQWVATLDDRTCLQCGPLDGQTWDNDAAKKTPVPVTSTHPNCFVPQTAVEGEFLVGTRMPYAGPVITIRTQGGHRLTVTPNHPVLTTTGMRPARALREGEHVFSRAARGSARHQEHEDVPAAVAQVFDALGSDGFRATAPRAGQDFHGDAAFGQGDVDVVAVDRELLDDPADGQLSQGARQGVLEAPAVQKAPHPGLRASDELRVWPLASADGHPRAPEPALDGRPVHARPFQALRVGPRPELYTALSQAVEDYSSRRPERAGSGVRGCSGNIRADDAVDVYGARAQAHAALADALVQRLAGAAGVGGEALDRVAREVTLDQVVEVRHGYFSGHVYDLQSTSGLIIAEGIVVSNCRCTLVPVVRGARELGLRPGTRASFSGQVPETLTYERWFGRQSAAFQREVLGPTRFRLYRTGALPLERFSGVAGVKPVRDLPDLQERPPQLLPVGQTYLRTGVGGPWEPPDPLNIPEHVPRRLAAEMRALPKAHVLSVLDWTPTFRVRLERPGVLGRDVLGAFNSETGWLAVDRKAPNVRLTFAHEFGHALDHAVGATGGRTWAYEHVSVYARTNPREAFAEAYAMYASPRGRAVMRERYPRAHAYMERVFAGRYGPASEAVPFRAAAKFERGPASYLTDEERLAERFARRETPARRAARIRAKKLSPEEVERVRRALGTHKPATAAKQRRGEAEQRRLARLVRGVNQGDNDAFDVVVRGQHAVEVKTVIDNDNGKVTVHPESRRRKEAEARRLGLTTHLVAVDVRGRRRAYYYRAGVGAFRLSAMRRVSVAELRVIFAGT